MRGSYCMFTLFLTDKLLLLFTDSFQVPVVLRIFTGSIWFGLQAYWSVLSHLQQYESPSNGLQGWTSNSSPLRSDHSWYVYPQISSRPYFLTTVYYITYRLRTYEELLLPILPPRNKRLYRPNHLVRGVYPPRPYSTRTSPDPIRYFFCPFRCVGVWVVDLV